MNWSIDPAGARRVCSETDTEAGELDSVAVGVANAFSGAHAAASKAPATAAALQEVAADPFLMTLAGMRRQVSIVTETTGRVISQYEASDFEMAAETQATMNGLEP